MSNYTTLKTTINANIRQNGNQEITGKILNSVLNAMVNTLGEGYQFAGVATLEPATDPGTPDAKVFYIANGKGTYTNFGGVSVTEDEVVVLYWDSSWHKVSTGIAREENLTNLEKEVATKANLQHQHTVSDITDFPELYYNATAFFTSGAYPSDKYEELLEAVKAKKTVYATLDEEGDISYVFFMSLANSDGSSSRVLLTTIFADGGFLYLNTFVLQQSGMTRMQENITGKANKATVDAALAGKQSVLTDTDGGYGQRVAELEKEGIASEEKLSKLEGKIYPKTKWEEVSYDESIKYPDKVLSSNGDIVNDSHYADEVNVYLINGGQNYRIYGKTYSAWTELAAFYSSRDVFDASTFISLVPYDALGNPTSVDKTIQAPSNAKAIAVGRYYNTGTLPITEQLKFYVGIKYGGLDAKVDEAPIDGLSYLRHNASWKPFNAEELEGKIDEIEKLIEPSKTFVSIPYSASLLAQSAKLINGDGLIVNDSSSARAVNVYAVDGGQNCKIVGKTYSGGTELAAFYSSRDVFDASTFISLVPYEVYANPTILNQLVTAPSNAKAIAICRYYNIGNVPFAEQLKFYVEVSDRTLPQRMNLIEIPPMSYRIVEDRIEVVSKYGKNLDRKVTLSKVGINNLFDFVSLSNAENEEKTPSLDFDLFSIVSTFGTDIHSPFQIAAKQNADGDNKSSGAFNVFFTGGQHGYNNTGTNTTATARTTSLKFLVDGKEMTDGFGYAHRVELRWTNRVQGYNTTKADGSGREILEESHTLTFDGYVWSEIIDLKPLEDIDLITYYSFQFKYTPSFNSFVKYLNADNRSENPLPSNSNSISKNCSEMQCIGATEMVRIFIDESFDLGKREINMPYGAIVYSSSNPKCYTCVAVNGYGKIEMSANTHYYVKGGYEFKPLVE